MGRNYPRHPGEREAYIERAPERVTVRMVDPANEQIEKIVEPIAEKPKRVRKPGKKKSKKPKVAVDGAGPAEPRVVVKGAFPEPATIEFDPTLEGGAQSTSETQEAPAAQDEGGGDQDDLFKVTEKKND